MLGADWGAARFDTPFSAVIGVERAPLVQLRGCALSRLKNMII